MRNRLRIEDESEVVECEEVERIAHRDDEGLPLLRDRNDLVLERDILRHPINQVLRNRVLREVGERQLEVDRQTPGDVLLLARFDLDQRFADLALIRVLILERLLDLVFRDPTLFEKDLTQALLHGGNLDPLIRPHEKRETSLPNSATSPEEVVGHPQERSSVRPTRTLGEEERRAKTGSTPAHIAKSARGPLENSAGASRTTDSGATGGLNKMPGRVRLTGLPSIVECPRGCFHHAGPLALTGKHGQVLHPRPTRTYSTPAPDPRESHSARARRHHVVA